MSCDPKELGDKFNLAENMLGRAMRAAYKGNFVKAWSDAHAGIAFAEEALAMCHDEVPHEHEPAPAPSPTPAPTPTDPPHEHEPPPTGDVLASSVPLIPSNFAVGDWVGAGPPHTERQTEGQFRMTGNVWGYSYDDPIVYPRQRGAAHLHEWIGNTMVDAFTTYQTLREHGNGTTEGNPLNRSAYWQPPVLLDDMICVPMWSAVYYKRPSLTGKIPRGAQLARLPRGLAMIGRGGTFQVSGKTAELKDMAEAMAFAQPGDTVILSHNFPDLWDGVRVDSADHESHMARATWNPAGYYEAPPAHPFLIARIQIKRAYKVLPGEDWTRAELSSDRAMGAAPGTTAHGDYLEGWDRDVFEEIEAYALDLGLNCNGGDMGSGRQLKRPPTFTFEQKPSRVPLADIPVGGIYRMPGFG